MINLLTINIWNYFKGYVIFKIEGLNIERIINLAIQSGVYIWDVKRIDYTTIKAKTTINGYKEIEKILERTGCKSTIDLKVGYPFFISRLKGKKIIALGAMICFFLIIIFSSFVWSINIQGNKNIEENDIIKSLEEMGLYKGVLKYNVNTNNIKNDLLIKYDKIAWIGIELNGIKANIKIIEKDKFPNKVSDNTPCNIVAKKNGIIHKVIAKNGDPVVKKGDIVKTNEVLISGTIIRDNTPLRYVHSLGEVYARTFYEKAIKIPLYKITKEKTGKIYTKRIFKIGGFSFSIDYKKIPYNKYILEKETKGLSIWRNKEIPIELIIEEYHEINEKKIVLTEEAVKKSLEEKLVVDILKEIPEDAEILNKSITFEKINNSIVGNITIESLESIGIKEKVDIINTEINNKED